MSPGVEADPALAPLVLVVLAVLAGAAVLTWLNGGHRRGIPGLVLAWGMNVLWTVLIGGAIWHWYSNRLLREEALREQAGRQRQLAQQTAAIQGDLVPGDSAGRRSSRPQAPKPPSAAPLPAPEPKDKTDQATSPAKPTAQQSDPPEPDWVSRQQPWTRHGTPQAWQLHATVHTEFYLPEDELAAQGQLQQRVCQRAAELALVQFELSEAEAALVARKLQNWPQFAHSLVRETYRQRHQSATAGTMYRLHALVVFDQQAVNRLESLVREVQAIGAARRWVAGFGWLWLAAGVVLVGIKVNLGTGGRFRRALQWGTGGVILALGGAALWLAGVWPQ